MNSKWPRKKISELCIQIVDCVNKTAPSVDYETPYKMIRTPNIKNGRVNLSGCRYVEKDTFEKWTKRATVDKGDVLLTREAPLGEVGIVNFQSTVFLGQRIVQYKVNPEKLDSNYLLYAFLSSDLQSQFRRHDNSGSIVSHIPVPQCYLFEINTPPLELQKKIAKVLLDIDAKIELNNRINAELEQMAKTLYDYWFVQFDFPFDFAQGKPNAQGKPYKSSGGKMVWSPELKREVPEGWEVGTVMEIADLLGGGTPNTKEPTYWGGSIPFFTPTDKSSNAFVVTTNQYITDLGLNSCSSKLFSKGTIFITARGTVGNINIASTDMAMNQSCYALHAKPDIHFSFLYLYANELVTKLKAKANGSVFDAIVTNDFKFTKLVVPPVELIRRFTATSVPVFEKILKNQLENQHLSSLRDWLLPMLMNGQVKVGEIKGYKIGDERLGMVAEP